MEFHSSNSKMSELTPDQIESLEADYFGYIESWLQINFPHLAPVTLDFETAFSRFLANFEGLSLGVGDDVSSNTSNFYVDPTPIPVDIEESNACLRRCSNRLERGLDEGVRQKLLEGQIADFIVYKDSWITASDDELFEAFLSIKDPTGIGVDSQRLLSEIEQLRASEQRA